MPGGNTQDNATNGRTHGLDNLFALACLAGMTEDEQRGVVSSSPQMGGPPKVSVSTATPKEAPSSPSISNTSYPSRRPAKKRAVPADFDIVATQTQGHDHGHGVAATTVAAEDAAPDSPRGKPSIAASSSQSKANGKPASKRPKKTKSSKQRVSPSRFKIKANQPNFPVILMGIMSAPQNKEFISFLSNGKSFIIVHPGVFAKNILPIHFDDNVPTFDQFLHLLAIWGFEVVKDPKFPRVNVYRHPMFRKGDWEACLKMKLPDPSRQENEAFKTADTSLGGNSTSNRFNDPSASRCCRVPLMANDLGSPSTTARSVTPPGSVTPPSGSTPSESYYAALSEQVASSQKTATQTAQPQQQHKYSSLGPKFTSMKENLLYSRLLSLQQPRVEQGIHQGQVDHACSPIMNSSMPSTNRRASLGAMPSPMPSHSLMANNAMSSRMAMGRMSTQFTNMGIHHDDQMQQHLQQQPLQRKIASYSDAQVQTATEGIISAAIEVLRQNDNMVHQRQSHQGSPPIRSRRHTIDTLPSSTSSLDAMTNYLLERSVARKSSSSMAMMGPRIHTSVLQLQQPVPATSMQHQRQLLFGSTNASHDVMSIIHAAAKAEVQTEAYIASQSQQQRKVSLLGSS